MSKEKLKPADAEVLAEMDHATELYLDLNESVKNADSDIPERVEYLRESLLSALGTLSSKYPRDDWSDEQKGRLIDLVRCCFAYRNEIRIFIGELKGQDCTEARMGYRMLTDEVFGAPDGVVH
jgi:hypothetical protein